MNEKQTADSRQQTGAGAEPAPEAAAEVVDAEVVEEVVVESEVVEDVDPSPDDEAEVAEPDPLADALRERDEYLTLAQRARADFENYRRRVATLTAEAELRGRVALARGVLPAIDNLQRALTAAGVDPADVDTAGDGLGRGVTLVYAELLAGLERGGVTPFDPAGERFDPTLHEAISTAAAEGVEAGTVIETLELGYRADQQVIRPARVVVSG